MKKITFSPKIKDTLPSLRLGCISCDVTIVAAPKKLNDLIEHISHHKRNSLQIEHVSTISTIEATRNAYKKLGKDPSRYRPSAEALTRRILQGKGIYQINNVVDLLNLISLEYGYSIGGYDESKIAGDPILDVGIENEPYEAIGRGELNIGSLPVFRDQNGAFGSPTSDSQRTKVDFDTNRFLMVILDFNAENILEEAMEKSVNLLIQFAQANNINKNIVNIIENR